jgi:ribulose kinase
MAKRSPPSPRPYKTDFPNPSWAEQNPEDWWACMGQSVKGAVAKAGVSPADIIAMSVDTTCCSVVALDASGQALAPLHDLDGRALRRGSR